MALLNLFICRLVGSFFIYCGLVGIVFLLGEDAAHGGDGRRADG